MDDDIPYPVLPEEIQKEPVINSPNEIRVGTNKILLKTSREIHNKTGVMPVYSKREGMGPFLLVASLIILAGAVYLYLKFINVSYFDKKQAVNTNVARTNTPPAVIERDYDIPVTYPYTKDSTVSPAVDPIDKSVFNKKEPNKIDVPKGNERTNLLAENNKLNPVSSEIKNKDFIFKTGEKYIVQVSSWSTERSANKHAAYFKAKGFQTEVRKTTLNKGTFYRVRVGYFNSENDAVIFYNKNR